jgi:translation elongation factor EF-1beta
MSENNSNNLTQKQFHEGLAQFTEDVLLPAIERIVENKLEEKLESKLEEKLAPIRQELKSIRFELEEINANLARLDKRTDEDTRGAFTEIEELRKKVLILEDKIKMLEAQRA